MMKIAHPKRWGIVAVLALLAAACSTPPDSTPSLAVTKDVTYAVAISQGLVDRQLDVYSPSEGEGMPVVVLLHGGSGSKDQPPYVEVSRRLAEQGVVVFNASYSPGTPDTMVMNDGRALREVLLVQRARS